MGVNIFRDDEHLAPSDQPDTSEAAPLPDRYLTLANNAYEESSTYWEANFYRTWQHSLSNFRSKHPAGSRYHTDYYKNRSKIFRPKTRAGIRRGEAAANMAFFATDDAVVVAAEDEKNELNVLAAEVRKELINYRLSTADTRYGMSWFMTLIGAYQDAMVMGAVCSCQDWIYEEKTVRTRQPALDERGQPVLDGETGEPWVDEVEEVRVMKDRPDVRLVPLENIRFSPAADWIDPVNSSPFFVELLPMYVYEVKERMKSGEWFEYENVDFARARRDTYDTVRQERDGRERRDPYEETQQTGEFSIVWVHRNFLKVDGDDIVFHTLGTYLRLDDPRPTEEVYPHGLGQRPYRVGTCMVETHRIMPSSPTELGAGLQAAANEIQNSRFDNVRLVLNKRYLVQRGANVDVASLTRSTPGGVTSVDDLNAVVAQEMNDVTSSSYAEQDRLNLDFDDVMGGFSSSSVQSNRQMNETVGGMQLLSQDANSLSEHQLRVFAETWVEPVIQQIDALEMFNESDARVLAIVGERSKAWRQIKATYMQQLGREPEINLDQLAAQSVDIRVNVGFGATNPMGRIQKMMAAANVIGTLAPNAFTRVNEESLINEVFGILGWQDGSKFFHSADDQDPRIMQLQQQIQQLQQMIEVEAHKAQAKAQGDLQVAQAKAQSDQQKSQLEQSGDVRLKEMELDMEARLKQMELEHDRWKTQLTAQGHVADLSLDRGRFALEKDRYLRVELPGAERTAYREDRASMREDRAADREDAVTNHTLTREQDEEKRRVDYDNHQRVVTESVTRTAQNAETASRVAQTLQTQLDAMTQAVDALAASGSENTAQLQEELQDVGKEVEEVVSSVRSQEEQERERDKVRKRIEAWLKQNGSPEVQRLLE
jgi:hypothetical protein